MRVVSFHHRPEAVKTRSCCCCNAMSIDTLSLRVRTEGEIGVLCTPSLDGSSDFWGAHPSFQRMEASGDNPLPHPEASGDRNLTFHPTPGHLFRILDMGLSPFQLGI
ncbi:hypothetical protein CEXT_88701 [Caerostris extrusa]|uniref:Uncharacterized protein n=1 Tax=Caerostris extrusa TaxID=172846 RepID=A0AAV4XAZ5_CAEEX|nr:hypothetical protein CEXT_88701 [Caerostris extrusa]